MEGKGGTPSRFTQWPPEAVRLGFTERKPSGISSATVYGPWCLGQFQLSFSAQRGGHLASPAMFAKR